MENYKNVSQDIRDQLNAEVEAIQIILTGMDNDIHSTVDACPNACEMWKAVKRLKQGGESLESYYSRFYKMMNELSQELKTVSYHKLYDILKQHQNEVNEIIHLHLSQQLLCKQEEAGVQLNAEQADWKDDTDDEYNTLCFQVIDDVDK
ncbi:hypothetical protein Tco_1091611, partial [Tanacetum coccineum]